MIAATPVHSGPASLSRHSTQTGVAGEMSGATLRRALPGRRAGSDPTVLPAA
jgi:hypothetical protein